jgi:hypothetical protein
MTTPPTPAAAPAQPLIDRLAESLQHMKGCDDCAIDTWSACEGGREALAALDDYEALRASPAPVAVESLALIERIGLRFESGNSVPVDRAHITRAEYEALRHVKMENGTVTEISADEYARLAAEDTPTYIAKIARGDIAEPPQRAESGNGVTEQLARDLLCALTKAAARGVPLAQVVNAAFEAAAQARAGESADSHPEGTCERCRLTNVTWFCQNKLWNKYHGDYDILCPVCFVQLAEIAGAHPTSWELREEVLGNNTPSRSAENPPLPWRTILLSKFAQFDPQWNSAQMCGWFDTFKSMLEAGAPSAPTQTGAAGEAVAFQYFDAGQWWPTNNIEKYPAHIPTRALYAAPAPPVSAEVTLDIVKRAANYGWQHASWSLENVLIGCEEAEPGWNFAQLPEALAARQQPSV